MNRRGFLLGALAAPVAAPPILEHVFGAPIGGGMSEFSLGWSGGTITHGSIRFVGERGAEYFLPRAVITQSRRVIGTADAVSIAIGPEPIRSLEMDYPPRNGKPNAVARRLGLVPDPGDAAS